MSQGPDVFPVYVGHISERATPADLRNLFETLRARVVEVAIVAEHGFVSFNKAEDAVRAIRRLNGQSVCGQKIHVDYSQELARYLTNCKGERVEYTKDPNEGDVVRRRRRRRTFSPASGPIFRSRTCSSRSGERSRQRRSKSRERSRRRSRSREHVDRAEDSKRPLPERERRRRTPSPKRDFSPERRKRRPVSSKVSHDSTPPESKMCRRRCSLSRDNEVEQRGEEKHEETESTTCKGFDPSVDLRQVLKTRKLSSPSNPSPSFSSMASRRFVTTSASPHKSFNKQRTIKIVVKNNEPVKSDVTEDQVSKKQQFQQVYVGNLFNSVGESDVRRLLEPYGRVVRVEMHQTHAIVHLDCTKESSDHAIAALDSNLWMDNSIRVKYNMRKPFMPAEWPPKHDKYAHCDRFYERGDAGEKEEDSRAPRQTARPPKVDSSAIDRYLSTVSAPEGAGKTEPNASEDEQTEEGEIVSGEQPSKTKKDRKVKPRSFLIYSPSVAKNFLVDVTDLFSRYGTVQGCKREEDARNVASVCLFSSERQALSAVEEINTSVKYKGCPLRCKFAPGSEEDTETFRRRRPVEFRHYPETLIPLEGGASVPAKTTTPMCVQSLSGGPNTMDANISRDAVKSLLKSVRCFLPSVTGTTESYGTVAPTQSQQPSPLPLTCDPDKLTAVEGIVRSVHDKVAIIAFHTGFSAQLARFVPGQMYIDARKNLGFVIRNRPFHSWPTRLKEFLEHGASLRMDVKRLKEDDVTEARAITGETVLYAATPYVWKGQSRRPLDSENLRISNDRRNLGTKIIMKGVVKKVFSKWGILTIDSFSHGKNVEADVFFKIEHYFNRSTSSTLSSKTDSLLFHVAVGDLVALCCRRKDYLELTELVRNCGMTSADMSTTVGLKYLAMLVWPIAAEVDPYLADVAEEEELPCDFLATSSTLNGQLPASEVFRAWRGIISEIRLPAGGLIELEQQGGAQRERQVAYFHRSRLFVNGAKVSSSTDISVDLAPGDPCTVDVVPNIGLVDDEYDIHIPWVATAVHTTNRDRGTRIADVLRIKEDPSNSDVENDDYYDGRIVYLHRPVEALDPCGAGIAILDSGPYAGQRVDFEASQCQAFGVPLARADLGQFFKFGDKVKIKLKPYNNYCVDSLYLGWRKAECGEERLGEKSSFLASRSFDDASFGELCRGRFPVRPFLPLWSGQAYRGLVTNVSNTKASSSNEVGTGGADKVTVKLTSGNGCPEDDAEKTAVKLEASREEVFVYGNWLGRASDLSYVLEEGDEVFVEYSPLGQEVPNVESAVIQKADLLWVGGSLQDRPCYEGQATRPEISADMDERLWAFVRAKHLDEGTFRALVEGRFPPKKSQQDGKVVSPSSSSSLPLALDQETLAQAALLQQMKERFGPNDCLKAMMMLVSSGSDKNLVEQMEKTLAEMKQKNS